MNRSEIIELLCNLILDEPDQMQIADNILANLIRNRITVDEAENQYNNLIYQNSKKGYWTDKLKSKVVYESLKKYKKGNQELSDTSKMISSLITHAIIELQSNPEVSKSELGVHDLSELLSISLRDDIPEDFFTKLDEVLIKYGYL